MARTTTSRRWRGEVVALPSGSLRVKIYAGIDPVSGKRLYLSETVPSGPKAAKEAERARVRLLGQLGGNKQPKTRATVDQLLDRYLEVLGVEPTTRSRYESILSRRSSGEGQPRSPVSRGVTVTCHG